MTAEFLAVLSVAHIAVAFALSIMWFAGEDDDRCRQHAVAIIGMALLWEAFVVASLAKIVISWAVD